MSKRKNVKTFSSDSDYLIWTYENGLNVKTKENEKLAKENRKLKLQLIKLKAMLLVNTNVDWNFSEANAKEEFQNLYNLMEKVI
jgi:hypothetical protein